MLQAILRLSIHKCALRWKPFIDRCPSLLPHEYNLGNLRCYCCFVCFMPLRDHPNKFNICNNDYEKTAHSNLDLLYSNTSIIQTHTFLNESNFYKYIVPQCNQKKIKFWILKFVLYLFIFLTDVLYIYVKNIYIISKKLSETFVQLRVSILPHT